MNSGRSILVIGYGNPVCGDDGVGPFVARELRSQGIGAIDVQQLTPELAEQLSQIEQAIFIDSDLTLAPGDIRISSVDEGTSGVLEHHASPAMLLRLAREVYGRAPCAWLIGIGPQTHEIGDGLSVTVLRAANDLIAMLFRRIFPLSIGNPSGVSAFSLKDLHSPADGRSETGIFEF